jgi:pyruvate, orthophosphate dikinase
MTIRNKQLSSPSPWPNGFRQHLSALPVARSGRRSWPALRRLDGIELEALTHRRLLETHDPIARGVGASSGVASGRAAFDSAGAKRLSDSGDPVILVRPDTNTADVAGFAVSAGIVTVVGGRTAHAALVARQMGKPCVVGCDQTTVDVVGRWAQFATAAVAEGEWILIDGDSGQVYLGRREVVAERPEVRAVGEQADIIAYILSLK